VVTDSGKWTFTGSALDWGRSGPVPVPALAPYLDQRFPPEWFQPGPAAEKARAAISEGFCPMSVYAGADEPVELTRDTHQCRVCQGRWDLIPGGFRCTWPPAAPGRQGVVVTVRPFAGET
jgi:hypothetical protein